MKTKLLIFSTLFNIENKSLKVNAYPFFINISSKGDPTTTTKMTTREVQSTPKGQVDKRTNGEGHSIDEEYLLPTMIIAAVASRAALMA